MDMESRWSSRKYMAAWGLTLITTLLLVGPWAVNIWWAVAVPLITAEIWSSTLVTIWGSYFLANTAIRYADTWKATKANPDTPNQEVP